MILTRRAFVRGGTAFATTAAVLPPQAIAEGSASAAPDGVVIARVGATVLSARETHLVLTPVPAPRRPPLKPKSKGPAVRRMHLVLRDVAGPADAPVYDVYLVLEGPNVFEATVTKLHVGELKPVGKDVESGAPRATVSFDVNDIIAHLAKIRGYHLRHLRVAIVRRAAGANAVPAVSKPPEIGAIELVQS